MLHKLEIDGRYFIYQQQQVIELLYAGLNRLNVFVGNVVLSLAFMFCGDKVTARAMAFPFVA